MRDRTEGSNPTADAPGMAMYETTHTSLLEAAKNGNMTAGARGTFHLPPATSLPAAPAIPIGIKFPSP